MNRKKVIPSTMCRLTKNTESKDPEARTKLNPASLETHTIKTIKPKTPKFANSQSTKNYPSLFTANPPPLHKKVTINRREFPWKKIIFKWIKSSVRVTPSFSYGIFKLKPLLQSKKMISWFWNSWPEMEPSTSKMEQWAQPSSTVKSRMESNLPSIPKLEILSP